MNYTKAIKVVKDSLKKKNNIGCNTVRHAYKCTLALCFEDTYNKWKKNNKGKVPTAQQMDKISNDAAEWFLDIYSEEIEYPEGR